MSHTNSFSTYACDKSGSQRTIQTGKRAFTWVLIMLTCVLCVLTSSSSVDASSHKQTIQRYALLIGHNRGDRYLPGLRFAQDDAKKVARVLRQLGGYKSNQIKLMLSPSVQQVRITMKHIRHLFRRAHRNSIFLFYYSGHARKQHFQLGNDTLPFAEVRRFARSLSARVRIMLIDSCYSGRILRAKGAKRLRSIRWRPIDDLRTRGVAILTSSEANGRSYESDTIKSSLFTSSLLAGLRGAADKNKDQRVSFGEIHQYVYQQTLSRSSRHNVEVQRPSHQLNLRGQGPLYISFLRRAPSHMVFAHALKGHIFLYRQGQLVQDFYKSPGKSVEIGVNKGVYQVNVRLHKWLGQQTIDMRTQTRTNITPKKLSWQHVTNKHHTQKGERQHSAHWGVVFQYNPLSQMTFNNMGIGLLLGSGHWLRAGIGYRFGLANALALDYQTHHISFKLAVGTGFSTRQLGLWGGLHLEPLLLLRQGPSGIFWNAGFVAGLTGNLDYYFRPDLSFRLALSGGPQFVFFDQNIVRIAPALNVSIGVIWML